jgi:hypothetical protein
VALEGEDAEIDGVAEGPPARGGWAQLDRWISRHTLSKVGLELLSVFIGVTAAFALDNWRQARQQHQSADAVYKSVSEEVGLIAHGGPEIDLKIRDGLTDWQARYARGQRPVPFTYLMPRSPRPPTGVWEAAMSSGLINLLDTRLLFCLARYYRRLESSGEEYVDYKHFVENEVLPYADDPKYFYGPSGRLKPRFAGNMESIVRWQNEHVRIVHEAQQLVVALNRQAPPPQCGK